MRASDASEASSVADSARVICHLPTAPSPPRGDRLLTAYGHTESRRQRSTRSRRRYGNVRAANASHAIRSRTLADPEKLRSTRSAKGSVPLGPDHALTASAHERQGQTRKVEWIRRWWRQPDHYQWLSAYLAVRNLQRFTRYMMAAIVVALAGCRCSCVHARAGRTGLPRRPRAVGRRPPGAAGDGAAVAARSGPTRRQSAAFVVVANVASPPPASLELSPGAGIQSCAAFAALAGYVAFFHTSRLWRSPWQLRHRHGARLRRPSRACR